MNFTKIGSGDVYSNNQAYSSLSFNSTHDFVFSTQTNNLPIIATHAGM